MSDDAVPSPTDSVAIVRSRAAEWLVWQRDSGTWTAGDQAALDAWLAESPANEIAYIRLAAAWDKADRLAALRRPILEPVPGQRGKSKPFTRVAVLLAAAVIMVIFGTYLLRTSPNDILAVNTGVGGHKVVALADGSRIELNTDTAVRVALTPGARKVWLDKGEAFFDVRHDATRPFTVTAQGRRITDLGTKFSVRNETNRLEVALLEGRAQIEPLTAGEPAQVLKPGDVAIATPRSLIVTRKSDKQLINELAWRNGLLVFKYATLGSVADEFNRYNEHKIVLSSPSIARLSIVGTFRANDPNGFIELAKEVFNVRAQKRGGNIVLSR